MLSNHLQVTLFIAFVCAANLTAWNLGDDRRWTQRIPMEAQDYEAARQTLHNFAPEIFRSSLDGPLGPASLYEQYQMNRALHTYTASSNALHFNYERAFAYEHVHGMSPRDPLTWGKLMMWGVWAMFCSVLFIFDRTPLRKIQILQLYGVGFLAAFGFHALMLMSFANQ